MTFQEANSSFLHLNFNPGPFEKNYTRWLQLPSTRSQACVFSLTFFVIGDGSLVTLLNPPWKNRGATSVSQRSTVQRGRSWDEVLIRTSCSSNPSNPAILECISIDGRFGVSRKGDIDPGMRNRDQKNRNTDSICDLDPRSRENNYGWFAESLLWEKALNRGLLCAGIEYFSKPNQITS